MHHRRISFSFVSALALAAAVGAVAIGCGGPQGPPDPDDLLVELRGNRIVFNHTIEFEFDRARILEESYPILDRICELLVEHPGIYRVQIQGHSSTDGEEAHNQELSAARAESVAEYLRSHEVVAEVTSQGYGETYPLCREETEECNHQNRRVEFFVDQR
jgi:OOP family OmpA-OmpF porin